ncbi:HAD family phosphatase [Paraconexibacter antarcticus]|uniref:HAD family phosphatase n=1 Tax=Paraconexibacter antarcticus TaxID=2949664 RepID=A0ABY5DTP3_9ACTN|nr:HAD family phosphatase [Paraconexibacter antarcticus]UTI64172.1 HAD family phosphatase [Paraconexibacter antarcticus]
MSERRGLLMDWGGVLTTDVFASFAAFCEAEGLRPDSVRHAFMKDPRARELLAEFESGRLPDAEFETRFGAVLEVPEPTGLIGRLFGGLAGNTELIDAVAAFRGAGVRTGLLSNSWGTSTYPLDELHRLFDVLVISGEHGIRKPEPGIYALAVERMGMAPEELVFVDDLPGNLKPARALGIHTILHRDNATTLAELEAILGPALRRG